MWTLIKAFFTGGSSWLAYLAAAGIACAVSAAGTGYATWTVDNWRWGDRMKTLEREYDAAAAKVVKDAQDKHDAQVRQIQDLDAQKTKELTDAKDQIDRLRSDVAAGRKRLLVHARCPAAAGMSQAGGGAVVGDAAAPRLEGAAEQDYYTLLGALELMERQLLECQGVLAIERHAVAR